MRYFLPVLILIPPRYVSASMLSEVNARALATCRDSMALFPLVDVIVGSAFGPGFEDTIGHTSPRVAFAFTFAAKRSRTDRLWSRICDILAELGRTTIESRGRMGYLFKSENELHSVYEDAIHRFIEIGESGSTDSAVDVSRTYNNKKDDYSEIVSVIEGVDESHPGFEQALFTSPPSVQNAFMMAAKSSTSSKAWERTVAVLNYLLSQSYTPKGMAKEHKPDDELSPVYGVAMRQFIRVTALNLYLARVESIPSVPVIRETGETGLPGFAKLLADMPIDIVLAFVLKTQTCFEEPCWKQITATLSKLLASSYKEERGHRRDMKPITDIEPVLNRAITELAS